MPVLSATRTASSCSPCFGCRYKQGRIAQEQTLRHSNKYKVPERGREKRHRGPRMGKSACCRVAKKGNEEKRECAALAAAGGRSRLGRVTAAGCSPSASSSAACAQAACTPPCAQRPAHGKPQLCEEQDTFLQHPASCSLHVPSPCLF